MMSCAVFGFAMHAKTGTCPITNITTTEPVVLSEWVETKYASVAMQQGLDYLQW